MQDFYCAGHSRLWTSEISILAGYEVCKIFHLMQIVEELNYNQSLAVSHTLSVTSSGLLIQSKSSAATGGSPCGPCARLTVEGAVVQLNLSSISYLNYCYTDFSN